MVFYKSLYHSIIDSFKVSMLTQVAIYSIQFLFVKCCQKQFSKVTRIFLLELLRLLYKKPSDGTNNENRTIDGAHI